MGRRRAKWKKSDAVPIRCARENGGKTDHRERTKLDRLRKTRAGAFRQ